MFTFTNTTHVQEWTMQELLQFINLLVDYKKDMCIQKEPT